MTLGLPAILAAICPQIVELAKSGVPLLGGISAQVLGRHTAVPFGSEAFPRLGMEGRWDLPREVVVRGGGLIGVGCLC